MLRRFQSRRRSIIGKRFRRLMTPGHRMKQGLTDALAGKTPSPRKRGPRNSVKSTY
jgi:hypothetical protein